MTQVDLGFSRLVRQGLKRARVPSMEDWQEKVLALIASVHQTRAKPVQWTDANQPLDAYNDDLFRPGSTRRLSAPSIPSIPSRGATTAVLPRVIAAIAPRGILPRRGHPPDVRPWLMRSQGPIHPDPLTTPPRGIATTPLAGAGPPRLGSPSGFTYRLMPRPPRGAMGLAPT